MAEALVDSNVLFAYRSARDQWHESGRDIVIGMDAGELPTGQVTNYSLPEIVNPIQKAVDFRHALETLDFLVESAGFRIQHLAEDDFIRGQALFRDAHGVELTDCILVAYMLRVGLEYIYSFDDDFDRFKGITRLATPDDPFV